MSGPTDNPRPAETLFLGYPLDQLLDRSVKLEPKERKSGALKMPTKESPGIGNIIISGPPGSGKSTLALNMAMACVEVVGNNAYSAFVPLENTPSEIIEKAKAFRWDDRIREFACRRQLGVQTDPDSAWMSLMCTLIHPRRPATSGQTRDVGCPDWESALTCFHNNRPPVQTAPGRLNVSLRERRVILSMLSPRSFAQNEDATMIFWRRYRQLETLLQMADRCQNTLWEWLADPRNAAEQFKKRTGCRLALHHSNRHDTLPLIFPLVVIDSLNMFAPGIIEREELRQLFQLFRRYNRIGIFTVESGEASHFDSTLADVVISLTQTKDSYYAVKHLEILKSRYTNHVPGIHPYKPIAFPMHLLPEEKNFEKPEDSLVRTPGFAKRVGRLTHICHDYPRHGMVIFPSLHYIVVNTGAGGTRTDRTWPVSPKHDSFAERWGIPTLDQVLAGNLTFPAVVTVCGPRGSFKTDLAVNFLLKGFSQGEDCMLIHLHDSPLLDPKEKPHWPALSLDVLRCSRLTWDSFENVGCVQATQWQNLVERQRATITVWRKRGTQDGPLFFEVDFKTGGLMPEEMVQVVRDILIRRNVKRVVMGDVAEIGAGYPFLRRSMTSGDMFIPAFAHIIRNHGADLVMNGGKGELAAANEQVDRACTVSDAILSTHFCDVFGQRYVVLRGGWVSEGRRKEDRHVPQVRSTSHAQDEAWAQATPPMIRSSTEAEKGNVTGRVFVIDTKFLEGLVGFETGHIHRPGLAVHLFEEGPIQRGYNNEVEATLRGALADPLDPRRTGDAIGDVGQTTSVLGDRNGHFANHRDGDSPYQSSAVHVHRFGPEHSAAMHQSMDVLNPEAPLARTLVKVIDEFSEHGKDERLANLTPYYHNVLLIAYRKRIKELTALINSNLTWRRLASWAKDPAINTRVENAAGRHPVGRAFWIDLSATETMTCSLLDALMAGRNLKEFLPRDGTWEERLGELARSAKEVTALGELMRSAFVAIGPNGRTSAEMGMEEQLNILNRYQSRQETLRALGPMPDDAAVYVCWYSQLRELIDRQPKLAEELAVRALPGGGFKGDWSIGTVTGSVSMSLGRKVIELLCSQREQYRRYSLGVGLPVGEEFYRSEFRAWPNATVTLADIKAIRDKAKRRSDIDKYTDLQPALYAIVSQMSPLLRPQLAKQSIVRDYVDSSAVTRSIERLCHQADTLRWGLLLTRLSIRDVDGFLRDLRGDAPAARFLRENVLSECDISDAEAVIRNLNAAMGRRVVFNETILQQLVPKMDAKLRRRAKEASLRKLSQNELVLLNRRLLEGAFPNQIRPFERPAKVAGDSRHGVSALRSRRK